MTKKNFLTLLIATFGLLSHITMHGQDVTEGGIKFYENKNQWPEHVLYQTRLDAGNIWLEKGRILYHFMDFSEVHASHGHQGEENPDLNVPQALVSATFVGANRSAKIENKRPTRHYQNYFKGANEESWATEVKGYGEIKYLDFYDGIDLIFFEKDNVIKYEFHLEPFADPDQIQIKYEGYDEISIQSDGSLAVVTSIGEIVEKKPFVYQSINGQIVEVPSSFVLEEGVVRFNVESYDKSHPLILDPELIFSTFAGSVSDSHGWTATYGYDGTVYNGGLIFGIDYPTPAPAWNTTPTPLDGSTGISDVFISKYNADGTEMLWTNFIGGGDDIQGTESVHSLICDQENNVYFFGATSSLDFPIAGGFQTDHAGGTELNITNAGTNFGTVGTDMYVSKFSADGLFLLGSTYMGGSGNDGVNYNISGDGYTLPSNYDSLTSHYSDQFKGEIMLDSAGNILVASSTWSDDFPVLDGFQMASGGMQDAAIMKLTNDCSELLWSSYFGGANNDAAYSVKVDTNNNVFISGGTSSGDLNETEGGIGETYNGGVADGFVAKINNEGETLLQSTYIGTDAYDLSYFIDIDENDDIYIFGTTRGEMPITPGKYSEPGSSSYIWKINNDLSEINYSTLVGNGDVTAMWIPTAFSINPCGRIYMSGWSGGIISGGPLTGMLTTEGAFQEDTEDGYDFYMMLLDAEAEDLRYGTYFGGGESREHTDGGTSRFDENGVLYQAVCAGCGGNSDLPVTPDVWSEDNFSPNCNSAVFKFDFQDVALITVLDDTLCLDDEPIVLDGSPEGGVFTGTGIVDGEFDPAIAGLGSYTIYYTFEDDEGCHETTDSLLISVIDCYIDDTGIQGFSENKIRIYPNPFSDFTTVYFDENLIENHSIIIFDALGQEVYRNEEVSGTSLEIYKSQLAKGIYVFSLFDNSAQEFFSTKLLVE